MVKKNKKYDENELIQNRLAIGFLILLIIFLSYVVLTLLIGILGYIQVLLKGIILIIILTLISYVIGYIIFKLFPKIKKWDMEEV